MKLGSFHALISLTLTIFILSNLQHVNSLGWYPGNELRDLEWTGNSFIYSEVPNWYASSLVTSGLKWSVCAGNYLLGGYNILGGNKNQYFERYYSGLPGHNQVNIKFMFFPIDSWDGTTADDHFEVYVDGNSYYAWRLSIFSGYGQPLCGGSWNDFPPLVVKMSVPHTSSGLTFRVVNMLDQASDDESMGFRDVSMTFVYVGSPAFSFCGKADDTPLPDRICPCATGTEYMNPPSSGNCFPCNSACVTCDGGATTDCLSCTSNKYLSSRSCYDCSYNCLTCNTGGTSGCLTCQPSYPYMINGNTCVSTCYSPLYTSVSGSNTNCYTPCPGQYALWDGQCSAVCPSIWLSPRTYNTFAVCDYPCSLSQYLYYDGVCDNSCPSPLTVRDFHGRNYCDHTCSTTTDYLYWDVLCESYCTYPLTYITTHGRKICQYPCAQSQYLYWDQTCGNSCFFPQIIRTFHGKNFCDFPCTGGKFLYWNNTCISTCPAPLITRVERGVNYCDYPCSGTQYLFWNGSCLATCNAPLSARIVGSSRFCDYPCQTYEILHWLGTCVGSCAFPRNYVSEGSPARLFCYYMCTTSQYLYWNGTCSNTCNAPLVNVISESRNFCTYPCSVGDFLYWNGSCKSSCPSPLKTRVEASLNYCDYPCVGSEYLYWNGSCIAACNTPLSPRTTNGNLFCDYPCSISWYLYWEGTCRSSCPYPLVTRYEASRYYCDYPCQTSEYLYWNSSCITNCGLFSPSTDLTKKFCNFQCYYLDYIYWDKSCSSSCAFPLTSHTEGSPTRYFCDFPCDPSEYLYWNGSCITTCDFPLSPTNHNSRKFCNQPCSSSYYLYWNGSCILTCPFPLVTRVEGSRSYCDYPCLITEYLYWNGSCISTCNSPLVQRPVFGNNFCDYPCSNTAYYLYWDGACGSSCSSPLTPVSEGSPMVRKFCLFTCQSNEYIYWNGTCSTSCAYPLTNYQANSRSFCTYPCSLGQYLYWNQGCGSSCPAPHNTRVEGSRNFCDYPCLTSQYLYWNGTCSNTCNAPLTNSYSNSRYYCHYPCSGSDYLYWNGSCLSTCVFPHSTRLEAGKNYCDYPCTGSNILYWNGSCIATCAFPLKTRYEASKYYCDYPCTLSQYLYWNGSCLSGCVFPLSTRVDASRNYCDYPCPAGKYLYWNGTCMSACAMPLDIRIDAGDKYCDYKCTPSQILYWDGVCSTQCPSPRTPVTEGTPARNYCTFTCKLNEFLYWNGTCATTCKYPLVNKITSSRMFCEYPCTYPQFLNWDRTCIDACPLPFMVRREAGLNYCDYPCASNEYLYWNGSCYSSCASPLIQRVVSNNKFCDFTCAKSTDFLYWDGTCSADCASPLTQVSQGTVEPRQYCVYSCKTTEYLYWNGSCLATCPSPLTTQVIKGRNICNFPCDPSKFLYWDGTCSSLCPAPLTSVTEASRKYCRYKCSATQYLTWDGLCSLTCDYPYSPRAEKGLKYCDYPCDPAGYLYWNNTCSMTCQDPFVPRVQKAVVTRNFCDFPCSTGQYYATWTSKCRASCLSPYNRNVSSLGSYCSLPCNDTTQYYYPELGACKKECKSPYVKNFTLEYPQCYSGESDTSETGSETAGGMLFNALLVAPAGNGTLTLVKVVKAMQYMRYLDIKLPPRLERFGSSNGRGIMSLASNSRILDKIADSDVVKGTIPDVFATHHPDTSFIVNFWGTILFVISAVGAAVLFTILEKISKKMKWELAELIFVRMRVITRLNLVIMLLASSIDDVILYGSIEIRSLSGSTSIDYASLAVSIVFIGLVGAVMVGSFLLARKQQKIKNSVVPEKQNINLTSFETKWQDFQVTFRGFKDNKKLNPYFFFLYTIRIGFPMLITVCATTLPMIIISVQVITSVLILGYLFIMKPFKKRINQVQLVIYELIVLVMNVCMLFLTIFSVTNTDGGDFSVVIGDIVIIGNDCLNLLNLVFFVFRVVIEARVILRYNRSLKVKKGYQQKTRYIQLLALVFQQVNMGFEELIEEYPTQDSENVALKSKRSLKDVEGKSFIVEKTETHLYTQIEKTNENKTLPQNFDKSSLVNISGFNKEDTWMPAIEGGYTGQPLETTILKQEQRKPDYRQAGSVLLSPSQPRYDRLSSEASPLYKSKPLKKEEDVKVFNFDSDNTSPLATDKTRKSPILRSALSGIVEEKGLVLEPMESPKKVMLPPMPSVYQVAVEEKASPTKDEKSKKFLNYNWQGVSSPESTTNLLSPVTSKNTIQIDVAPKKVEEKAEKAVDGKRVEYLGDYIQDEPAGGNYKWKNSGSPKPRKGGAPGKSQEKSVKK